MGDQSKGVIEVQSTPTNTNNPISVQFNFDVVQAFILLFSTATIVFGWLLNKKIELTKKKDIQARIKKNDFLIEHEIEAIMNRMLAVAGASRVAVALFSNGEYVSLFSFRYFSIFWEVVDNGVTETMYEHQHKPLSRIRNDLMVYINNPNVFTKTYIEDPNLKEECKKYMLHSGIKLILGRLLGNEKDGFIGIINLHFEEYIEISQEIMNKLDSLFLLLEYKIESKKRSY